MPTLPEPSSPPAGATHHCVYEGGVRALRGLSSAWAVGLLLVTALSLAYGARAASPRGAWLASAVTLATAASGVVVRLAAKRRLTVDRSGWTLRPLLGKPKRMPALAALHPSGKDIVVRAVNGDVYVLGVEADGARGERARTAIMADFRRLDASAREGNGVR